jgi:hypothetical protein
MKYEKQAQELREAEPCCSMPCASYPYKIDGKLASKCKSCGEVFFFESYEGAE